MKTIPAPIKESKVKKENPVIKESQESMSERYKKAYNSLYEPLPNWKKYAIKDSLGKKRTDDSLLNDFIKSVIDLAESNGKKDTQETEESVPYKDKDCQ